MNLSEVEKRDLVKLIEAGKPLPDKYRFLLFGDKREVELVWNGKTSEVSNIVLPFQTVEVIDEPRAETAAETQVTQGTLFDVDARGRQIGGWTNKLIWGDNKYILSSLKSGPMREEIERQGGLKLIYIDPPFDVGADFSMQVEIGEDELTKRPNVLEELAYRDTWGNGADSFIAMIYERLSLMRDLLAPDGSIYVHCDYRVSGYMRLMLDEIVGKENHQNEIIWHFIKGASGNERFGRKHQTIYWYTKSKDQYIFNRGDVGVAYNPETIARAQRGKARYSLTPEELEKRGKNPGDVWSDLYPVQGNSIENTGYETQKPEALLERIIRASSNDGDIVADFFCGSGTTLAVAEKLGRCWIGSDLGKFAVHTTRKRMIGVQRELKQNGQDYRAFEIVNLGKYERQHYLEVNMDLRTEQREAQVKQREREFVELIVKAYKATKVEGFNTLVAQKAGRMVAVGPIEFPVTRRFVNEVVDECVEKNITQADVLSFEFELGLAPQIQDEAKERGVRLSLKYIPPEVFDKRAVERNEVQFHDLSYVEVEPHILGDGTIAVELTDFSVYYNQDITDNVIAKLNKGRDKVILRDGKIVKIAKDKEGHVTEEELTKSWTDWIDYWSVDFDYESRKEIVRTRNDETEEVEERWTGNYVFENEWQSFRTKQERRLELKSIAYNCQGRDKRKIAVKVVDIFGNDTMKVIEVDVGKKVMGLATPSVLKWARETAGYSVDEVAAKLAQRGSVTASMVEEWEREGSSQPTYAQLESLAKLYRRPVVLFFLPEPPVEEPLKDKLRSLPKEYVNDLPPGVRFLVREATVRQSNLAEIYDERVPEEYQRFKSDVEELKDVIEKRDSYSVAAYIRNSLGVPLEEQWGWKTYDEALRRWREAVEGKGIWVFKGAFRDGRYSAFSLSDERFPIIYLNNSMSKGRQIFALFHELGHLLLHKGGVVLREDISEEFQGQYQRDEGFCNSFAGELLVPNEHFPESGFCIPDREEMLQESGAVIADDEEMSKWANRYKVSRTVVLRRLRDLGLVSKDFYSTSLERLSSEYESRARRQKSIGAVDYYSTQVAYLGKKYLKRAFQKYYDHKISKYRLAHYLGVKSTLLSGLEERVSEYVR